MQPFIWPNKAAVIITTKLKKLKLHSTVEKSLVGKIKQSSFKIVLERRYFL